MSHRDFGPSDALLALLAGLGLFMFVFFALGGVCR